MLGAGIESLASSVPLFTLGTSINFLGPALVPVTWLVFLARYALGWRLSRRVIALLLAVPAATMALVWTNPLHEWMWAFPPVDAQGRLRFIPEWGPWFLWVHTPYATAVALLGFAIVGVDLVRGKRLRRAHAALLFVGLAVPFIVTLAVTAGLVRTDIHATSWAFAFTWLLFAWGFFRFELFQLSPLALRRAIEHVGEAVMVVDAKGRIAELNPAASELFELREEVVGRPVGEVLEGGGLDAVLDCIAAGGGEVALGDHVIELSVSNVREADGTVRGRVVLARDVAERRRAEAAVRESEELLRSIVDHSPAGVLRLRPDEAPDGAADFVCEFANPSAAAYLGISQDALQGAALRDLQLPHTDRFTDLFREAMLSGKEQALELAPGGDRQEDRWFRIIAVPVGGGVSVTFFDITERVLKERRAQAAASRDPLTGLLNRRGLTHEAETRIDSLAAVIYVDLDRFKAVNDRYGHDVGDAVLRQFARRLAGCIREADLAARVGGDEFVVLLSELEGHDVARVADRIRSEASSPFRVGALRLDIGASVGIASATAQKMAEVLAAADAAMYRAKQAGGGVRWAGTEPGRPAEPIGE